MKTTISQWFATFKRGRTNIYYSERIEHSNEMVVPENQEKIQKIINIH